MLWSWTREIGDKVKNATSFFHFTFYPHPIFWLFVALRACPRGYFSGVRIFLTLPHSSRDKSKILDVYKGGTSLFFTLQEEERRYTRERPLELFNERVVGWSWYRFSPTLRGDGTKTPPSKGSRE